MSKLFNSIATILIFIGIVIMAWSAGDCDGKCLPGNSFSEMMKLVGIGIAFTITGAMILISNSKEAQARLTYLVMALNYNKWRQDVR